MYTKVFKSMASALKKILCTYKQNYSYARIYFVVFVWL